MTNKMQVHIASIVTIAASRSVSACCVTRFKIYIDFTPALIRPGHLGQQGKMTVNISVYFMRASWPTLQINFHLANFCLL